jgi:hypothetical protein
MFYLDGEMYNKIFSLAYNVFKLRIEYMLLTEFPDVNLNAYSIEVFEYAPTVKGMTVSNSVADINKTYIFTVEGQWVEYEGMFPNGTQGVVYDDMLMNQFMDDMKVKARKFEHDRKVRKMNAEKAMKGKVKA